MVGKEDPTRFTERYCKYNEINNKDSLVWFHAASVGEMMSIVPIIRKFEKNNKIKKFYLQQQLPVQQIYLINLILKKQNINIFQ